MATNTLTITIEASIDEEVMSLLKRAMETVNDLAAVLEALQGKPLLKIQVVS